MSDTCRINVSTLKSYENNFKNELNNFNNNAYSIFSSSYLKNCTDPYVKIMGSNLLRLYTSIKKGYDNIDEWWVDYNENAENLENFLSDNASVGAISEASVRNSANSLPILENFDIDLAGINGSATAAVADNVNSFSDDISDRVGATIVVGLLSLVEGVLKKGEQIFDGIHTSIIDAIDNEGNLFNSVAKFFSHIGGDYPLGEEAYIKACQEAGMEHVSKNVVEGWFDWIYEKTGLKEEAYGYNAVRNTACGFSGSVSIIALAAVTGWGTVGAIGFSAVAGVGSGAETAWREGATLEEGTKAAYLNGAWEGIQWGLGAAIGMNGGFGDKLGSLFGKITGSAVGEKVASVVSRLLLDTIDGGVEGFVQPAIATTYKNGYYDDDGNFVEFDENTSWSEKWTELFDDAGGWKNVMINAIIGFATSVFGELMDIFGRKAKNVSSDTDADAKTLSDVENVRYNVYKNEFESLSGTSLISKFTDELNRSDLSATDVFDLITSLDDNQLIYLAENLDSMKFETTNATAIEYIFELYNGGKQTALNDMKSTFGTYREHGIVHATLVTDYALNLAKNVDGVSKPEIGFSSIGHDTGMRAEDSYLYVGNENNAIKKMLGEKGIDISNQQYVSVKFLKDNEIDLDSGDIGILLRKQHPLNSALNILTSNSDIYNKYDVNPDVCALLAYTHSKSTSGIRYFSSRNQFGAAIEQIDTALKQYNIDHGTNYTFDKEWLMQMLDDDSWFKRISDEALIIRDADAMSRYAMYDGKMYMQDGSYVVIDVEEGGLTYELTQLPDGSFELKENLDVISDKKYDSDGKFTGEVTDSVSKAYHLGESNVGFSSTYNGIDYKATITILDPEFVPQSTFTKGVFERLGEVNTYTNCGSRSVEIVLPKEYQGTDLGKYYEQMLHDYLNNSAKKDALKPNLEADYAANSNIVTDDIYQSQLDFYNNIKIVYR